MNDYYAHTNYILQSKQTKILFIIPEKGEYIVQIKSKIEEKERAIESL